MKKIICALLLSLSSHALFAWGENGHRIVAQICYDNLSEKTRNEINAILGDNYITQIATWPDYIRSEKNWEFTKPWHFTTINPGQTVEQVVKTGNNIPGNSIEAVEMMKAILKGDSAATKKFRDLMNKNSVKPLANSIRVTALAFLVHLIGDIHQPMHVGKNNDFGGNKIIVLFFSVKSNLHSVWDEGIIEQEQLSFTEFAGFVEKHTASQKAAWQIATIDTWAKESVEAREIIYNTLYDNTDNDSGLPSMSYNYQHDFLPTIEARLGAAGYRAAAVLNSIFN
jgi:S1/P1 Nuclease